MSADLVIEIPGNPVGKGRPRLGIGRVYTPAKTRAWEKSARVLAKLAVMRAGWDLTESAIEVWILACFEPPKSWTKARIAESHKGGRWHSQKPDGDNIAKACLDALDEIVFRDDCQVAKLTIEKRWASETGKPGVTIIMRLI